MSARGAERIHSLEIPLVGFSLLVPSAVVAEVANPGRLHPVPQAPRWVLGVMAWRAQPVPVVSFEALCGRPPAEVAPSSRIVVFYPLAGAPASGFYGLPSAIEPRPQAVTPEALQTEQAGRLPETPLIGAGVRIKGRLMLIPDLDALREVFYPKAPVDKNL